MTIEKCSIEAPVLLSGANVPSFVKMPPIRVHETFAEAIIPCIPVRDALWYLIGKRCVHMLIWFCQD